MQREVLKMFYGPVQRGLKLPKPIEPQRLEPFEDSVLVRNNFNGWFNVWRMELLLDRKFNKGDIYEFRRAHEEKFVNGVKNEMKRIGSIKVSFGIRQEFERVNHETGEVQIIKHYFAKDQPTIFMRGDSDEKIRKKFEDFKEMVKAETDNWSEAGSGWEAGDIDLAYINVARYQPLRGGTYIPLPASLAKKKAIINVRNKGNKCLKWAIRAALFPPQDVMNPQRPSKYPVEDGIDYTGIEFPTPIKQIDRLEAQNEFLAINVFGWEKK